MASKTLTQAELEAYPIEQANPGDPYRYQAHGQWLVFEGGNAYDVQLLNTTAIKSTEASFPLGPSHSIVALKSAVAELQAMIADHEDRLAIAEEMIIAAMNRKRPGPKPKLAEDVGGEPEAEIAA
jgi:hypothetical protein